jgi:RsiG-like
VDALPDLGSLTDEELKALIDDLEQRERDVSYQRKMLHGHIDILRAELVARLQASGGRSVLDQLDVDRLSDILSGKAAPPA